MCIRDSYNAGTEHVGFLKSQTARAGGVLDFCFSLILFPQTDPLNLLLYLYLLNVVLGFLVILLPLWCSSATTFTAALAAPPYRIEAWRWLNYLICFDSSTAPLDFSIL